MVPENSERFISGFGGPIMARQLVSGLPEEDKQRLSTIMRRRQYEKGHTIFAGDMIPAEVVIVTHGNAQLESNDPGASRVVVAGEVIGLTETLAEAKYRDKLTAITDCVTNVISRDDLIWYLRTTPEACYRSLEVVAENLHRARENALG